jgi:hypothetical protein
LAIGTKGGGDVGRGKETGVIAGRGVMEEGVGDGVELQAGKGE